MPRQHGKNDGGKSPKKSKRVIAVERAYSYLRKRAIRFEFTPGERVNEAEISQQLNMSRSPVREALNRLATNGLFDAEPGRGFFSRRLSVREVSELLEIREDLELPCILYACENATREDIDRTREEWAEVAARQDSMDIEELVDADEQFHLQIAEFAGNDERLKFIRNINDRVRFIRLINLDGRRNQIIEEHAEILDAIQNKDAGKASELMKSHLMFTPSDLQSTMHEGITRIYAEE